MTDNEIKKLFGAETKNQHNSEVMLPIEALPRLGYAGPIAHYENGKATLGFNGNTPKWLSVLVKDGLPAAIAAQAQWS